MCNFRYYLAESDGVPVPIRVAYSDNRITSVEIPDAHEHALVAKLLCLAWLAASKPQEMNEAAFRNACSDYGVFPTPSTGDVSAEQQQIHSLG